jgi:hypothetical protein
MNEFLETTNFTDFLMLFLILCFLLCLFIPSILHVRRLKKILNDNSDIYNLPKDVPNMICKTEGGYGWRQEKYENHKP